MQRRVIQAQGFNKAAGLKTQKENHSSAERNRKKGVHKGVPGEVVMSYRNLRNTKQKRRVEPR